MSTLHVVGIYDRFVTAVYAQEAAGSLGIAVRPFMHVESSVWSFDMLARLDLRHPSIRAASGADVIIVAADPASPLPLHVKTWLTRSLQENVRGAPLIAVIHEEMVGGSADATLPLYVDLGRIARQWGTPLLRNGEFDARLESGLAEELTARREQNGYGIELDGLLSLHTAGRWGINE